MSTGMGTAVSAIANSEGRKIPLHCNTFKICAGLDHPAIRNLIAELADPGIKNLASFTQAANLGQREMWIRRHIEGSPPMFICTENSMIVKVVARSRDLYFFRRACHAMDVSSEGASK